MNQGIALFEKALYRNGELTLDTDNSFVSGLRNTVNDIEILCPTQIEYGINRNELWFATPQKTYSSNDKENLPKFCINRIEDHPLAYHLELMGIPCFPSPTAVSFFNDKRRVLSFLASHGIETVTSVMSDNPTNYLEYPFFGKAAYGCGGEEVHKINNDETLRFVKTLLNDLKNTFYQKSCPTGSDLRVYMLGNRPFYAVLRKATSIKANLADHPEMIPLSIKKLQQKYPDAYKKSCLVFSAIQSETGLGSADFLFEDKQCEKPLLNEITIGLIGTTLLTKFYPNYIEEYLTYIKSSI